MSKPSLFTSSFFSGPGLAFATRRTYTLLKFQDKVLEYVGSVAKAEEKYGTLLTSLDAVRVPDELESSPLGNAWAMFETGMERVGRSGSSVGTSLLRAVKLMARVSADQVRVLDTWRARCIRAALSFRAGRVAAVPEDDALFAALIGFLNSAEVVHHDVRARLGALLRVFHHHFGEGGGHGDDEGGDDARIWGMVDTHLAHMDPMATVEAFVKIHSFPESPLSEIANSSVLASDEAIAALQKYDSGSGTGVLDESSLVFTQQDEILKVVIDPPPIAGLDDSESPIPRSSKEDGGEDLPPGWSAHWDPNYQRYFYYNALTDQAVWDLPTTAAAPAQPSSSSKKQASSTKHKVKKRKVRIRKKRRKVRPSHSSAHYEKDVYVDEDGNILSSDPASPGSNGYDGYDGVESRPVGDVSFVSDVWGSKRVLSTFDISALGY